MNYFAAALTLACTLAVAGCANDNSKSAGSVPMARIQPAPGSDTATQAAAPTLNVGDPAPAITVTEWIKGSPVNGFQPGKVYVVEFWATWCPPCAANIPHLTAIQKKYPQVVVIGVTGSERRPAAGSPDNRLEKLRDFVSKQGNNMNYRVAYDSERAMPAAWMEPAGRNGIPCVFIVGRDSRLAWIGHPSQMDSHLQRVVSASAQ